jgi:hypothetical protein
MHACHTTLVASTSPIPAIAPLPARGWTPRARTRFLDHLALKGNVRAACARVGLSAEAAYRLRRRDPLFARGWAAALVLARDTSEQVLATRAIDGVEQPVFHHGEQIGTRCHYDTRLLLAHLARLDRLVAQNQQALEDAGRFDEMLARIAGERFPEELAVGDDALPGTRAEIVGEAVAEAQDRLFHGGAAAEDEDEEEDEDGGAYDDDAGDYDDDYDDGYDDPYADPQEAALAAAGRAARAEAEAQWDGWFAQACAVVDELVDPQPTPELSDIIAAAARGVAGMSESARAFASGTVSTVSTSALARALQGPARGFTLQHHAASPARKRASQRG